MISNRRTFTKKMLALGAMTAIYPLLSSCIRTGKKEVLNEKITKVVAVATSGRHQDYSEKSRVNGYSLNKRIVMYKLSILIILLSPSCFSQDVIWERHLIDSAYSGADGVRLADINNDSLLDIATGWEEGGYTKVYLHPGYDKVTQKWPTVIAGKTPQVEDAVFADLDNDGAIDVVSCTEWKHQKVYINWAPKKASDYLNASEWQTNPLPASEGLMQWMYAYPAQIDGKCGLDIVAGGKHENAQIGWFQAPKNSRDLSAWQWNPISNVGWVMSIEMNDMDKDGDVDIIITDRKGKARGVRWLENPGKGKKQKYEWRSHHLACANAEVMFMDIADLDGDGLEDIITTEVTTHKIIFLKRLDTSGLNWKVYSIDIPSYASKPKSVAVGDINQDGKPDLVHSFEKAEDDIEGIFWLSFENHPTDSVWQWHSLSGPKGIKYDRIELLDLDGDGDLDVLTCEENYGEDSQGLGVIWYENSENNNYVNQKDE